MPGCNSINAQNKQEEAGTKCDTSYVVSVDDMSSEGGEARICKRNNKVVKVSCTLYGETGKLEYDFDINEDSITVNKKLFSYAKPLMEVKEDKDIVLKNTQHYSISKKLPLTGQVNRDDAELFLKILSLKGE